MGGLEFDFRFADAVIVAAGSSTRMGGIDKLLEPVGDMPLLQWSVEALSRAETVAGLFLVVRPDRVDEFKRLPWLDGVPVIPGGKDRSDSVRAGLAKTKARVVLVHDGARPLVSIPVIDAVAQAASKHGAAVPVVPVVDSLKRARSGMIETSVDRSGLVRTQTPQGARRELLLDAFAAAGDATYTDEAALLESRGVPVATVAGEPMNIKVTEPADLEIVRAIAAARAGDGQQAESRLGLGQDAHGFGPQMGLQLGGVEFGDAPRLHGHSDGDVVLHALSTAILSAAGLGDLGRLFPSSDQRTAGIASIELLAEALRQAAQAGWRVSNVQVSMVGARPRLGAQRIDAMRLKIGQLLDIDEHAVAITASTGNLYGAEGAGRVISAICLVGVYRR